METEQKIGKESHENTDEGYSEKKLARQVDRGLSSKQTKTVKTIKIFVQPKSSQTIFQAPKEEKI
jgi:hypothetical protein